MGDKNGQPVANMKTPGQAGVAKNVKTVWREAEKLLGDDTVLQAVDPLHVIETVMRYFYSLAQTGRKANAPLDEVRKCFERAADLAALAAPYRHARLSAVRHIEYGDTIDGISANATPEELRAEIAKRVAMLRDRGYLDLEALPPPEPAARS
jgi:hypothetical protein